MSAALPRTLVVVPAWNEAATVGEVIAEIKRQVDVDVLVVDDGSTDTTAEVASEAGALVARLPFNLGVGGAMRAGYRYALRHGYDVAVQVDADGQHDPADLPKLVAALDGADIVIGARFAHKEDTYSVRWLRWWAMLLLAWVLSRVTRTRLTDVTSGYRAANRRGMAAFARHYPAEYLGDTVESLVIAARLGCVIRQVPVTMRTRGGGRASHSPVRSAIYLARAVVALVLALTRRWDDE